MSHLQANDEGLCSIDNEDGDLGIVERVDVFLCLRARTICEGTTRAGESGDCLSNGRAGETCRASCHWGD